MRRILSAKNPYDGICEIYILLNAMRVNLNLSKLTEWKNFKALTALIHAISKLDNKNIANV